MAESTSGFSNGEEIGWRSRLYPDATPLFTNGITSERIERVMKPLSEYLRRLGMASTVVANHWRSDGAYTSHEGWLAEGTIFERLVRGKEGIVASETTGYSVFLHPDGVMQACITEGPRGVSRDIILSGDRMDDYYRQTRGTNPFGWEIPDEARLLNRVSVGGYMTRLAMAYGILDDVRPFAISDPPGPNE